MEGFADIIEVSNKLITRERNQINSKGNGSDQNK